MNFTCPEGCKVYYAVNGDQLDLNEDQGTVDLKSGQKKVNYIFFLSFVQFLFEFFDKTNIHFWHITVCIHQWFVCNLWMRNKWWWRLLWGWGWGPNLKFRGGWRKLQKGFPHLCLSQERSIGRRHQYQFPKSKGQTMLSQNLHHSLDHQRRYHKYIGVSWRSSKPTQPGPKDLSKELWRGNLATAHVQWHSFRTQWKKNWNGIWTILYWTSTKNIWVWDWEV